MGMIGISKNKLSMHRLTSLSLLNQTNSVRRHSLDPFPIKINPSSKLLRNILLKVFLMAGKLSLILDSFARICIFNTNTTITMITKNLFFLIIKCLPSVAALHKIPKILRLQKMLEYWETILWSLLIFELGPSAKSRV